MKAKCHECGFEFDIDTLDPGVVIECPGCRIHLRIITVSGNKVYMETEDDVFEQK
ncbi:MAG: hypothetical protein NT157_05205 [Candidatus Micrarchaeota archaeon]|nr:hypothetical protein [Candidatus Micrarchaeota archaeon]